MTIPAPADYPMSHVVQSPGQTPLLSLHLLRCVRLQPRTPRITDLRQSGASLTSLCLGYSSQMRCWRILSSLGSEGVRVSHSPAAPGNASSTHFLHFFISPLLACFSQLFWKTEKFRARSGTAGMQKAKTSTSWVSLPRFLSQLCSHPQVGKEGMGGVC